MRIGYNERDLGDVFYSVTVDVFQPDNEQDIFVPNWNGTPNLSVTCWENKLSAFGVVRVAVASVIVLCYRIREVANTTRRDLWVISDIKGVRPLRRFIIGNELDSFGRTMEALLSGNAARRPWARADSRQCD